ncbi:MAG: virginiamycin lyase, partial [Actinomycetota bacterium]|nr:virginiamycin lyase [Actinomycetota bacterium]
MKSGPVSGPALRARSAILVASILVAVSVLTALVPSASAAGGIASVNDYATPGSFPWGTAFDSTGKVWVALPGCDPSPSCSSSTPPGKLALFNPSTSTWSTVVSLPAGYGQPLFVALDSGGKVWFTMPVTNAIGVYDPVAATVRQWAVPTASSGPWGIAIDSSGKIWFTEHYGNKIGAFNPASSTFQEVATPAANSNPYGITVDSANNVWFAENNDTVALIGEYTAQGVLKEFKIRNQSTAGTGLTPHDITLDRSGNLWWSEGWVHTIGTLKQASAVPGTNTGVTEYAYTPPCSSCGSHTSGIATDSRGLVWFDDSLQNIFGSLPVGGGAFSFYSTPGGHPHDGLNVDSQDRIWFDEEFAHKLGKAVQSATGTTTTTTPGATTTTAPPTTTTTTAPGTTSVLGIDTFQRANQSLWGTSSDGHVWGGDANSSNVFSVAGNAGLVTGTGSTSYSAVLGASATDSEVYARGAISSFANSNFGTVLRWADGNNWYKAFLDGGSLFIQKKVGGTTTMLATVPFPAQVNTPYSVHFRAVGSTLTANAWPSANPEPAGWMLTATDTSLASGFSGMRFLTQAGTVTVTSFQAK